MLPPALLFPLPILRLFHLDGTRAAVASGADKSEGGACRRGVPESEVSIGEVSAIDKEEEEKQQRLEEDVADAETLDDDTDKTKASVLALSTR